MISFIPSRQMPGQSLNQATTASFLPSQFIIYLSLLFGAVRREASGAVVG
jgi:hypothetical protein